MAENKERTADEIREQASGDPLLSALIDSLKESGCRLMGDAEFRELLEAHPVDEEAERAKEVSLLQIEAYESGQEYAWRGGMGEISGFGGGYELTCRKMLRAGLRWMKENPDAEPQFKGYKGIYGIIDTDNEAAEQLSEAVVSASGGDCTGAMHQAVISHCLMIAQHDWDWYCEQMSKEDDND